MTRLAAACACALLTGACSPLTARFLPVSIAEITRHPSSFEGRRVAICGRPLATSMARLCPGYVGLDPRTEIIDAEGRRLVALGGQPEAMAARSWKCGKLWSYEGYIRVFRGEIGCPGQTSIRTVPYFEITAVHPSS